MFATIALCPTLLPPAAADPRPFAAQSTFQHGLAVSQPPSFLDRLSLAVFRYQLQQQSGTVDPEPGFEGMLNELRDYQRTHSVHEQAECSTRILKSLAGPIPAAFRAVVPRALAPAALAWCAQLFAAFLVGPMTPTQRARGDARAGGVLVKRCKVLERSGCAGLCLRMCKLPTERTFAEQWGTVLSMRPNFETCECQLSFGVEPTPIEDDPSVPHGCLAGCPLSLRPQHPGIRREAEADGEKSRSPRAPEGSATKSA